MVTRAKILGSLLLAGALALGSAATIWTQTATAETGDYPIAQADCAVTTDGDGNATSSFPPGGDIQVFGDPGCVNLADVEFVSMFITSHAHHIATVMVDEDGGYSAFTRVPVDIEPGTHTLRVHEGESSTLEEAGPEVEAKTIEITEAGAPAGLPETGRDIALLVLWGTLSLVLGSVLVGVTWRRWRESRVAATVESAWADEASALGVLEAGDAAPYSPTATEWIDPPRDGANPDEPGDIVDGQVVGDPRFDEDDAPLDETAEFPAPKLDGPDADVEPEEPAEEAPEVVLEAFEAEIAEAEPNGAEPNGAEPNGAEPTSDPEEIARRASRKTSEILDRLQDDLAAWKR